MTRSAIIVLSLGIMTATLGVAPSLAQQVPAPPTGTVGPGGSSSGGHDPVVRGNPTQTLAPEKAALTLNQCQNFVSDWMQLSETRQAMLRATKEVCDELIAKSKNQK